MYLGLCVLSLSLVKMRGEGMVGHSLPPLMSGKNLCQQRSNVFLTLKVAVQFIRF